MKESGKLHTICDEMDRNKLEILAIAKTNWTDRCNPRTHKNKTIIYLGKDGGHVYSNQAWKKCKVSRESVLRTKNVPRLATAIMTS